MPPRRALLLCVLISGCNKAKTDPTGLLDLEEWSASTRNGRLQVDVQVESNTGAFLLSAQNEDDSILLSVEEVYNPSGELVMSWEDWWYSSEWPGESFFPYYKDMFFNWPIREQDGPLTQGKWKVVLGAVNKNMAYKDTELELALQRKQDSNNDRGTVYIWLVYAKGLEDEDEIREATESAIERWREVWSPYGLQLEVEATEIRKVDPKLPIPGRNSDQLLEASSRTNGEQITVVIGETVDGDKWTYGMAGGIPGGLVPTDRSAIAISWLAHAGTDGKFSKDETRLYGESVAHEVGHYMGLPHPVEDGYESWDALDDTPQCTSQTACEDALGENIMYPYSICSWTSCLATHELTDDQVGVAQRYAGTL